MFVVIDWVDASWKTTQLNLLKDYFNKADYTYETFDFPQYDLPSSFFVKEYLNWNFKNVTSQQASLFYALDRYYSKEKLLKAIQEKDFVLSNRYTTSNIIHQATKAKTDIETTQIIKFIEEIEYDVLWLPKPDKVIFLDMHIDIAWKLLLDRWGGKGRDIHENDYNYLKNSYEKSLKLANKLGWEIVKCYEGKEPLSKEEINQRILNIIFSDGFKNK